MGNPVALSALQVASETTPGNPNSSGTSTGSGLTYQPMEFERASVKLSAVTERMSEKDRARAEAYMEQPEPEKWEPSSEVLYEARLPVEFPVRGIGAATAYATYAAAPQGMVLGSGLCTRTPGNASDTVSAGSTANRFTPTDIGRYLEGGLFRALVNSLPEYSRVTDLAGGLVYHTPACSAALTNEAIRFLQEYYVGLRGTLGDAISAVAEGPGRRFRCHNGRVESYRFSGRSRAVYCVANIYFPLAIEDHAKGAAPLTDTPDPIRLDGRVLHTNGAYCIVSDDDVRGVTAPAESGRTALDVDDWSVTITNKLTRKGRTHAQTGVSDLEVADVEVSAEVNLSAVNSTFDTDWRDEVARSLLLGMSGNTDGNGGVIMLPSAVLQRDPAIRDDSGEVVRTKLVYGQGRWSGDDSTTLPGGSPFVLGLML